mmetsp:Transcript_136558/g.193125  ORF Transcript_136558/g.193125 Transcript_136558/m.193125 type:complete len:362 (-) Transcript_136558:217-1302(-)
MATESESRRGPKLACRQVQDMHGQTNGHGVRRVSDPLLVGDEEVVLNADAISPLVPHLQVRRAEGLHEPVRFAGSCGGAPDDVIAVHVHVALVHIGSGGLEAVARAIPRPHKLPLQVVGLAHGIACSFHHALRFGRRVVVHEAGQHAAIVVDVVDVRPGEASTLAVHHPGEGLRVGCHKLAICFALVDQPHRASILQVCPQAVWDACEHGACRGIDLAHGRQHLDVAMWEVGVAGHAVHQISSIVAGIRSLTDRLVMKTHRLHSSHVRTELDRELHAIHLRQQVHGLLAVAHPHRAARFTNGVAEAAAFAAAEVESPLRLPATALGLVESPDVATGHSALGICTRCHDESEKSSDKGGSSG